jgi:mycothiol synthase
MSATAKMMDVIDVPTIQEVPGLAFRAFRGEADYAMMADLLNECFDGDAVERVTSAEDIAQHFRYLENCDPFEDMVLAEVDGEVAACGRAAWYQESCGNRIYQTVGHVRPGWRRKGIGTAILAWMETRLREIAAAHPEDGARFFQDWASTEDAAKLALLTSAGYAPCVYAAERLRPDLDDLPEAPMPEGLIVRDVRPRDYRAIYDAANEAMRDHWGHVEPSEDGFCRFLAGPHIDLSLWRVAWDGSQVAGIVRGSIDYHENDAYGRSRGTIEHLSVRRPWRRRGLARSLLIQCLHTLRACGMEEASLDAHVETLNGASRLYKSVGFRIHRMFAIMRKPMM